jgi:hypothetical protein
MEKTMINQDASHDAVEEASEESFPASDPPSWNPITKVGEPAPVASERSSPCAEHPGAETAVRQVQQNRGDLRSAMEDLETSLTAPVPNRESEWASQVARAIRAVGEALARHRELVEGDQGLLMMMQPAPRALARRVGRLRPDHTDLVRHAQSLGERAERMGRQQHDGATDIRQRAVWLLGALLQHLALEADIIAECFGKDISAGPLSG